MNYCKPLLLLGAGAKGSKYLEFAEKYQYPIVLSRLAIDLVPYSHPLHVGHAGIYGDVQSLRAFQECDLLFIAGCRLSATSIVGYQPDKWSPKSHKVMVDIDPLELQVKDVKIDTLVNTSCQEFFDKLLLVPAPPVNNLEWVNQCHKWKRKYKIVSKSMMKENPINSYYFTECLSNLASPNDIILVDTGSCFHVVAQAWKIKRGQKFITTGGLSSMGWWAGSLGAGVLGHTLCITGDGSLMMNLQELATVKNNNLPIKIFVWNNQGYGLIRATQNRFMEGRFIGIDTKTGLSFPDFRKIADAFGLKHYLINDNKPDKIIKQVLEENQPVICEVTNSCTQILLRPSDLFTAPSVSNRAKSTSSAK